MSDLRDTPAPQPAGTTTVSQPVRKFDLPNGLRLLVKEDHRLPFVEFRAVLRGGVLAETATDNGITQLLSRMLLQGTATRNAEQIADEIESVGGSVDTFGGNHSFGVGAEVMREDFALGLDIVLDVLRHPAFPASALERERAIQIAGIKEQRDQVLPSAIRIMRRALFGGAGYGLDTLGTEESVASLTQAGLAAFHQRLAVADNCVLAVYGDVPTEATKNAVAKLVADWKSTSADGALAPPDPRPTAAVNGARRAAETRDKKQAVVVVGFPGSTLDAPDRFALELLQEACSDLGSRLFLRIREQLGLAYYVGAQNFLGLVPGYFAFYAGTAPETAGQVERELVAEAKLLGDAGLTPEELQRAKAKVIGQKKIARQDLAGVTLTNALDELFGLGFANADHEEARFEAVTSAQVQAAARKYLHPDAMVLAQIQGAPPGEA
jgi:zinc protease